MALEAEKQSEKNAEKIAELPEIDIPMMVAENQGEDQPVVQSDINMVQIKESLIQDNADSTCFGPWMLMKKPQRRKQGGYEKGKSIGDHG